MLTLKDNLQSDIYICQSRFNYFRLIDNIVGTIFQCHAMHNNLIKSDKHSHRQLIKFRSKNQCFWSPSGPIQYDKKSNQPFQRSNNLNYLTTNNNKLPFSTRATFLRRAVGLFVWKCGYMHAYTRTLAYYRYRWDYTWHRNFNWWKVLHYLEILGFMFKDDTSLKLAICKQPKWQNVCYCLFFVV